MFQRGITILLICCTLAANFTSLFEFAGFSMNQKYIASTLCENRDKPWLHCNGRCYLMKKIKLAEDKQKSEERETQKNLLQQVFCSSVKQFVFKSRLLQVLNTPCRANLPENLPIDVLRPPQLG